MQKSDQIPIYDPVTPNRYNHIANQLVDSFQAFTSIDDLRRHLKLMLKTIQHKPNQHASKEITQEAELLNCFQSKLFEKVRGQFPLLFKQQVHFIDQLQIFSSELETDKNFFGQVVTLISLHRTVQGHLQTLFDKFDHKEAQRQAKSATLKRQIRKAPKVREPLEQTTTLQSHIYVRLMAKSQSAMQFMLKNKNFPRLQLKYLIIKCRISINQYLQNLVDYLEDKWLKNSKTNRLVLYPDQDQFLKKLKIKGDTEPLNMYYMMTDLLSAYDYPKNNIIGLYYDFIQSQQPQNKNNKVLKPIPKKIHDVSQLEQGKFNLFAADLKKTPQQKSTEQPQITLTIKPPPPKNDDLFDNQMRYDSIHMGNDSLDLCSLFKRPGNSNSIMVANCNYSNKSIMGFSFFKKEDTSNNIQNSNHLQALRETIKLVEGEEKQKLDDSFSAAPESQVASTAVPVIKRKNFSSS